MLCVLLLLRLQAVTGFEEAGGLEILDDIRYRTHPQLAGIAGRLADKYFNDEVGSQAACPRTHLFDVVLSRPPCNRGVSLRARILTTTDGMGMCGCGVVRVRVRCACRMRRKKPCWMPRGMKSRAMAPRRLGSGRQEWCLPCLHSRSRPCLLRRVSVSVSAAAWGVVVVVGVGVVVVVLT